MTFHETLSPSDNPFREPVHSAELLEAILRRSSEGRIREAGFHAARTVAYSSETQGYTDLTPNADQVADNRRAYLAARIPVAAGTIESLSITETTEVFGQFHPEIYEV